MSQGGDRRITLAIGVALLAGVAFELWNVAQSYTELGLLDLQVYRMGGQALLDGTSLYGAHYVHDGLPFTYTPFAAVLFVPLALLGWTGGAGAITAITAACVGRTCVLIERSAATRGWLSSWSRGQRIALLLTVAVWLWPTRSTFEFGQINAVVVWLVLEDVLGAGRTRRWGGALVGLAVGLKVTPAFFIVFFVVSKQYRKAMVATATSVATVLVGFLVVPSEAWSYWTRDLVDPDRVGDPSYLANQSINGVLFRVLGPDRPAPVWIILATATAVGCLIVGVRTWRRGDDLAMVVVIGLGALLVSPVSWSHHWLWLLAAVPLLTSPAMLADRRRTGVVIGGLVLGLVVLVGVTRPMTVLPFGEGVEYGFDWWQQVVAAMYVLVGVLVLGVLAVASFGGSSKVPST